MTTKESSKYLIHESIINNKPLMVENLLIENPNLVFRKDDDERTPFHWACSMNNEIIIDMLIKYSNKLDFDFDELIDLSGWSPIHITCAIGNLSILNKLMRHNPKPDINLQTNQGTTALHLAISKQNFEVVKELVNHYQCSCRIKDKKGMTALHRAACIGNIPIIKLLVDKGKANVNATDIDGWTGLHHAMAEGHGDAAITLVNSGTDKTIENNQGHTALQIAVDDQVANFFIKNESSS